MSPTSLALEIKLKISQHKAGIKLLTLTDYTALYPRRQSSCIIVPWFILLTKYYGDDKIKDRR
jgi:hypothetical protein